MTALDRRQVDWALTLWAEFPVADTPRPLVLNGSAVFYDGVPRDGVEKEAIFGGVVESAVDLPVEVLDGLGDTTDRPVGTGVVIAGSDRIIASFDTDRGPVELPAWRLRLRESAVSITVLDPTIKKSSWWPPAWPLRQAFRPESRGWLGPDGRTLTLEFMGLAESFVSYPAASAFSSSTAVTIVPVPQPVGPRGRAVMLGAIQRRVVVTLDEPLGARVLVETTGQPVTVMATAPRSARHLE
jgi:hypothetical protein